MAESANAHQSSGAASEHPERQATARSSSGTGSTEPLDLSEGGKISELFERHQKTSGPLLTLRGVGVHFGGVAALSNVTFDVEVGTVAAVVGANGAGKSTLLNMVTGLLRDQNREGLVTLSGREIQASSPVELARLGVGRSFQDPPLVDSQDVLSNVMVGLHSRLRYTILDQLVRRRRMRRLEDEATDRTMELLRFLDLDRFAHTVVGRLPFGTRKLIDIARAVVSGPQLLLLDEPTSGLDKNEQDALAETLLTLQRSTPVTTLMVEHHMDLVRRVADKAVVLGAGEVVAVGSPEEVLRDEHKLPADATPTAKLRHNEKEETR